MIMKRVVFAFWMLAAGVCGAVTLDKPSSGKYWAGSGEGREMVNAALDALNAGKVEWRGSVTTAQRDALTPAVGDFCYNSTAGEFQAYDGSAWGALGGSSGNSILDLAAGTALTVGTDYFDDFAADRTLTFSGSPTAGDTMRVSASVTAASVTLTIPASYRLGTVGSSTSVTLAQGSHELSWLYADGKWWLADTAAGAIAAGDVTSGTFADARISESSVTQHETALTITESQIYDLPGQVSVGEITAGTEVALRRFSPADVKAFVDTHAGGGGDLSAADIDTLAELNVIVVDATLRNIDIAALIDGATISLDASVGSTFRVTLGGDRSLAAPTNPTDGQVIDLEITQDATGGRVLTLPTGAGGVRFGTDAPSELFVLSTGAGLTDYLTLKYRASADRWDVLSFIRGY